MQHQPQGSAGAIHPLIRKLMHTAGVRREEVSLLLWSMLYIFCVLSAYYVIRPIRDTLGIDGGVNNLQWLFAATLIVMILLTLPFSALSSRLPRRRFIPWVYRFFIIHLLIFAALMFFLPAAIIAGWGECFLSGSLSLISMSCRFSGRWWQIFSAVSAPAGYFR
ncbi:Npt1/Npt2 family nucleotide transporter [Tatumella ptyseos]|uniref:ADP,ATP carrier protein n=1 Tax=Tatumella ptyseos TaxID=82987 RepID=A0A2X5NPR1_9GAMM|nr:Npt1/Npt2 family nucleotide transporter [Tatumella ptyseos]SQK74827.1 Uncharacterised protein [Tatumella ptyseos]